ncbi:MAG TPA: hypothetical protein VI755_10580 [Anaerolineales bacterium]|nr:hypothetical protein [Anaerolineales bacterium]
MQTVEIRVGEHIDEHWSEWFNGFKIVYTATDETILIGDIEDKSELYGLIAKLRDLGVSLVAVNFQETSTLSEES